MSCEQTARFRAAATHLGGRLASDCHGLAGAAGLQDSAPRSALLALHARMAGVGPDAWEHPDLAQIWFRWADYVVARPDLGIFTIGAAPTHPGHRAALEALAARVDETLDGRALAPAQVATAMGLASPIPFRFLSVTGRIKIRWDARTITMFAVAPPQVEASDARRELGRRFLSCYGPATPTQFARWAGLSRADADDIWSILAPELLPVSLEGRARWMLARDEDTVGRADKPAQVVRLLPAGDPYLQLDKATVTQEPPAHLGQHLTRAGVNKRVVNGLAGRVLLDGQLIGSWGRAARKLTVAPWQPLTPPTRARIQNEIDLLETPIGGQMEATWFPPP
jgi:hypothetical protein